ncbi:MAG TPA: D-alanine--D-alanine ligase family protein [Roseiflexaceae bacterium]|nr:D-alanine--D-alanine ligase family protein [Roseiflexaceae bacterium]
MSKRIRVGVLFGGQSGEHEVSITSARAVMAALDRDKYDVLPIGITKQGRWIAGDTAVPALVAQADPKLLPSGADQSSEGSAQTSEAASDAGTDALSVLAHSDSWLLTPGSSIDVIFPVLHGPMGEDGTVQGLLELAGVPYVGCGVLGAAVGMDKAMMKAAFAAADLPLVPWLLIRRADWQRDAAQAVAQIEAALHYPVFVKPANLGSSVGITKATDRESLERGLAVAAGYDRRIVVEQGIDAREIEVSILGNDDPVASVPGEIVPSNDWYDYEAKYLGGESRILIPAPVASALAEQVQQLGMRAFTAIDGAGLARVDFLLERTTEELYLNEANTMPGFTSVSMYAKMWEASGLSYGALLDRLIELAMERHKK